MSESRHPARPSMRWRIAVGGALVALLLVASRASAMPTGLVFRSIGPAKGHTLLVARTAANNPLDAPTFQLKADVFFRNDSGAEVEVTKVTFRFPGSSIPGSSYEPKWFEDTSTPKDGRNDVANHFTLPVPKDPNELGWVPIYHGLEVDLPTPLPATVEIDIEFNHDGDLLTIHRELAFNENAVPLRAHFFPAKAEDLATGEYWTWKTRHTVDQGGGVEGRIDPSPDFALDMAVVAAVWNGAAWVWSELKPGATYPGVNDDYLVYGKPLYAMGDGVVVGCYRGEEDRAPGPFPDDLTSFAWGNSLFIRYGDDVVGIGHMASRSIPEDLCPIPFGPGPGRYPHAEAKWGLNIPVAAGTRIGNVGNNGYSTNAHIHLGIWGPFSPKPFQFVNVRALAHDADINNLIGAPFDPTEAPAPDLLPLHGMSLHKHSLVLPNPCGFDLPPGGLLEFSVRNVPLECSQDIYNMVVARGYAPRFIDGYDVAGQTYFNVTFRLTNTPWVARLGLTGDQYQALFDELTAEGYRLHQVDSYPQGGGVRYAAVFEIRPGHPFEAFHGLDDGEYAARLAGLRSDGYVPVNVSTVEVGGSRYWTGLFEQVAVADWAVQSVPVAAYQSTFDSNVAAGRLPIHVNGFNAGGQPFLTGIWVNPMGGSWAAVHDRTGAQYEAELEANAIAGRFTRYTTGYDDGAGSPFYAGVWRGRPSSSITAAPDKKTNQTTAAFEFVSGNPFATFECRLDGGAFAPCTSPSHVAGLAEGSHTFDVQAVDRDQFRESPPVSFTWLVDTTPPEITILQPVLGAKTVHGALKEDPVDMTTVVGWADVAAGVTDNLSGVHTVVFKVDGLQVPGAAVSTVGSTWRFEFNPDQQNPHIYRIEVIATDHAGNTAATSIDISGIRTMKPR